MSSCAPPLFPQLLVLFSYYQKAPRNTPTLPNPVQMDAEVAAAAPDDELLSTPRESADAPTSPRVEPSPYSLPPPATLAPSTTAVPPLSYNLPPSGPAPLVSSPRYAEPPPPQTTTTTTTYHTSPRVEPSTYSLPPPTTPAPVSFTSTAPPSYLGPPPE